MEVQIAKRELHGVRQGSRKCSQPHSTSCVVKRGLRLVAVHRAVPGALSCGARGEGCRVCCSLLPASTLTPLDRELHFVDSCRAQAPHLERTWAIAGVHGLTLTLTLTLVEPEPHLRVHLGHYCWRARPDPDPNPNPKPLP